jgi:hypothetical protein
LRAANQARTSCAAPIGSGTVNLVLKPHASPHVLTPEKTARKPPIASQTISTSMATMRRRPEAMDDMVAVSRTLPRPLRAARRHAPWGVNRECKRRWQWGPNSLPPGSRLGLGGLLHQPKGKPQEPLKYLLDLEAHGGRARLLDWSLVIHFRNREEIELGFVRGIPSSTRIKHMVRPGDRNR